MEETISVAWVDRLSGIVPSSVVGIPSVTACIDLWVLNFLNLLISKSFLDLEKLSGSGRIDGMTSGTNSVIPCWSLSAKEVTVDGKLNFLDYASGTLMIWIRV